MTIEAYPLTWPPGWKRTSTAGRVRAKFAKKGRGSLRDAAGNYQGWDSNKPLTIEQARQRVMDELRRFGVGDWNIVISSNLALRLDGLPRSSQSPPKDPGVAVYWKHGRKEQRCMAIDQYDRVADNLAAIAATLGAMRAIERHGGAAILDRAFTGFVALPSPEQWWQVLGVSEAADAETIRKAHRELAWKHHPDRVAGEVSGEMMTRINRARDQGMEKFQWLDRSPEDVPQ